jgi:hypothetical protein
MESRWTPVHCEITQTAADLSVVIQYVFRFRTPCLVLSIGLLNGEMCSVAAAKYAMARFVVTEDGSPSSGLTLAELRHEAPVSPQGSISALKSKRAPVKRVGNEEGVIRQRTETTDVSVSGPQFFGFGNPDVQAMLATLPNASIVMERGLIRVKPVSCLACYVCVGSL